MNFKVIPAKAGIHLPVLDSRFRGNDSLLIGLLLALLLWAAPAHAVGVDERTLDDPALEAEAREIMKELRCLVCQNQSIEDSDADLARDLRMIVRDRVAAGDDEDEVKAYLVERYGEWVLLRPPFNLRTAFLWIAPALLILGAGLVLLLRRRWKPTPPPPLSAAEEERLRSLLDEGDARR